MNGLKKTPNSVVTLRAFMKNSNALNFKFLENNFDRTPLKGCF